MDELTGFQRLRLELADTLRALLPIAHGYGDQEREREIRELLARLAAGRFKLAVAGQFSRGKTTLMNALLGAAYLPMGALPMTSVLTTIRYGTTPRALVRSYASSLPVEVPVSDVARFVAQASADRTRMRVASVEVEIPAELLRLGFEFVDTPGVGSAIASNTAATLRFLPQADAVVFVTGFDSALTESETGFLAEAAKYAGKLFLVINKRDLAAPGDAAAVTGYVQRWSRENLHLAEPPVFGISALHALQGAIGKDPDRLAASGIEPLRAALTRFLTAEHGRVALGNVASAAAVLVGRQQRDLRIGRIAADGGPDPGRVAADFDARMADLRAGLAAAADRIAGKTAAAAADLAAERGAALEADLRELIAASAGPPAGATAGSPGGDLQDLLDNLEHAGGEVTASWLEQRTAEVQEAAASAAASDIGDLLDLARSPRDLGAVAAGLPVGRGAAAGWTAGDLPVLPVPAVRWVVSRPPVGRRKARRREVGFEAAMASALTMAVAAFLDQAAAAWQDATMLWARLLREQAERHADAEAARFRHYLATPPREDDFAVLAGLAERLAGYRKALTAPVAAAASPQSGDSEPPAGPRDAVGRCEICAQMETALTEYLIDCQFQLAVSEDAQARHARTGGFCTLHTWQYARIASPVGLSAGNAALAGAVAEKLERSGSASATGDEAASDVAALASAGRCGACAVLARRQQHAARELAAGADAGSPPTLCLHHVALVLRERPSAAAGRAMIDGLAGALRRTSQDMRTYALKREALRSGLITAGEASAYSDALRLIAGQPVLATPWESPP